ncbi:MAG: alpha-galactosidase [Acidobacteria bacterium]|nr:alpha-galactosidase [Acidobacteriota bacterium]
MPPRSFLFLFICLGVCFGEDFPILTPPPSKAPRIHGALVYGSRPGKPFLYRIPCTGERPLTFRVSGLPPSLTLDPVNGILSGKAPDQPRSVVLRLEARNRHGKSERRLELRIGDTISLTPPMGWNHWYTHYHGVSDQLFRQAADAMVASGMADFGYSYVSIDDCWMSKPGSPDPSLNGPARDANGAIAPNGRFPDMKGLTAYIHAKGLKAGIYSSPGPLTCAKYTGSYQHEAEDARVFAEWGFDLLKYDWCSYGTIDRTPTVAARRKPYDLMGELLKRQDRDIHLNLCQYGMSDVWKWAPESGGQSWRTTGDLGLEKDTRLPGFYSIAFKNAVLSEYAGPGKWNDPDYILIGVIGNARDIKSPPKRTALTAGEQYSYMSMWSLMASPLFFSGDMGHLDPFTLNILCNSEVIDVNQDALGKQARVVRRTEDEFVLAKPLAGGLVAVGLFNLSEQPRKVSASWADLHLTGRKRVRDVWRQKDIGTGDSEVGFTIERHGVRMVRLAR